jgi:rhodanese-related sulfurtransferase
MCPKTPRYIFIVGSGNRSQKATDILLNAGFDQVENLGGIQEAAEKLKLKIVN